MDVIDEYLSYLSGVRRYSQRTCEIYRTVLDDFRRYCGDDGVLSCLTARQIRSFEVTLLDGGDGREARNPRTVNLYLSVLSGFCKYLMKNGMLKSNPVGTVARPKMEKRLPEVYREESLDEYFSDTGHDASADELELLKTYGPFVGRRRRKGKGADLAWNTPLDIYERRLARAIVATLYSTGIRRSELISLDISSVDLSRRVLKVRGKGDKMREIPMVSSLCEEISLYLQATVSMEGHGRSPSDPLFITSGGGRLYPVYVDRVIKGELGKVRGITGRKSPHVLRHSLATELLDEGADLNSIKELLGHSSLAATQVYTHNSVERLRKAYFNAHPRAKNGGKHGD